MVRGLVSRAFASFVFAMVMTGLAQATQVSGRQPLTLLAVTAENPELALVTQFSFNDLQTSSGATGDFFGLGSPLDLGLAQKVLDLSQLSSFSFTSSVFGTFSAVSGTAQLVGSGAGAMLAVTLNGSFVAAASAFGTLPDSDLTPAQLIFSLSQPGGSSEAYVGGAELIAVPLPGTASLFVFAGLLVLFNTAWRKGILVGRRMAVTRRSSSPGAW